MIFDRNAANPQRDIVDLRSDTVTRPTAEMYEAMLSAPLGDDVLGDEPSVARLEALAAEMLGKESALFVPSGTMGNQIAILCHTERGDAMIAEEEAHIVYYECGGPGALGGVTTWTLPSVKGVMDPAVVETHVLRRSDHTPGTTLLAVENTHNRGGGTIVPLETLAEYRRIADRHDMKIHLDGARVFNAAVGLGVPVSELCRHADSVSFCLSKGLGSPVGSLLCGSAAFIEKGRQWRKRLGGGLRQSGVLAACGIISLTKMVDRLEADHRRARQLAEAIADLPGFRVDLGRVQTNMVLVETKEPALDWLQRLKAEKVWALDVAPNRIRFVLHADIDDEKLWHAIEAIRQCAVASAR